MTESTELAKTRMFLFIGLCRNSYSGIAFLSDPSVTPLFLYLSRFITVNTIEERIKDLQDKKLILANNVLTGTMNTQASKLTLDDLKMLFSAPSQVEPVGNAVPLG